MDLTQWTTYYMKLNAYIASRGSGMYVIFFYCINNYNILHAICIIVHTKSFPVG